MRVDVFIFIFETCLVFCVYLCKIAKPPKLAVMVVVTLFAMSVCHRAVIVRFHVHGSN